MDRQRLDKLLAQVQNELRNAESMDPERKKALQITADEIQQRLDNEEDQKKGFGHFGERLKSEVKLIEAKHPSLTLSISELVDALSKIGV